ncbi:MAG TPA: DUF4230 domain-containing protein [Prevotellaceae bacterium]|nr:DUF4230 domain-containing protein [Prevotellaceae bacterium]
MKRALVYLAAVSLVLLLALGGFRGCKQKLGSIAGAGDSVPVDTAGAVMRLRAQSRLYTSEYRIHKIVTHDDLLRFQGQFLGYSYEKIFHLGDRKIAIPINATFKAYVDFSGFSEKNVERYDSLIHIILPDPRVILTSSSVDHDGIRQYTSMFRSGYSDREMADLTAQGVESIIAGMGQTDIIERARESAARVIIPLMVQLGYRPDHVVVTFRQGLDLGDPSVYYDSDHSVVRWEGGKR